MSQKPLRWRTNKKVKSQIKTKDQRFVPLSPKNARRLEGLTAPHRATGIFRSIDQQQPARIPRACSLFCEAGRFCSRTMRAESATSSTPKRTAKTLSDHHRNMIRRAFQILIVHLNSLPIEPKSTRYTFSRASPPQMPPQR